MQHEDKFSPIGNFHSPGFIGCLGSSEYSHRFGGQSWKECRNVDSNTEPPTLLAVIDLNDPRLPSRLQEVLECNELPLFIHLNCDGITEEQEYGINAGQKLVTFTMPLGNVDALAPEDRLSTPLPEKNLVLREMLAGELPIDENSYWDACDSFLGGEAFLRIFGPPVFLEEYRNSENDFMYIAGVGYESAPSNFLVSEPYFPGEFASYFFVSESKKMIKVVTQAS